MATDCWRSAGGGVRDSGGKRRATRGDWARAGPAGWRRWANRDAASTASPRLCSRKYTPPIPPLLGASTVRALSSHFNNKTPGALRCPPVVALPNSFSFRFVRFPLSTSADKSSCLFFLFGDAGIPRFVPPGSAKSLASESLALPSQPLVFISVVSRLLPPQTHSFLPFHTSSLPALPAALAPQAAVSQQHRTHQARCSPRASPPPPRS